MVQPFREVNDKRDYILKTRTIVHPYARPQNVNDSCGEYPVVTSLVCACLARKAMGQSARLSSTILKVI